MTGIIDRIARLIPNWRPYLRPLYAVYVQLSTLRWRWHRKTRDEVHAYWRHPSDGRNLPQEYVRGNECSKFLVNLMKRYGTPHSAILEIGCNVGRNLHYLFVNDFGQLTGIEISDEAVKVGRAIYPEMRGQVKVVNAPAEEGLAAFGGNAFDIVFTMAVLQNIHPESQFIFSEMARITKDFLITIEDEHGVSWRRFPRNYKRVFEGLGFKQVYESKCDEVVGLGKNFIARVFRKNTACGQSAL
jgi:SAM-dependent methyltransferase